MEAVVQLCRGRHALFEALGLALIPRNHLGQPAVVAVVGGDADAQQRRECEADVTAQVDVAAAVRADVLGSAADTEERLRSTEDDRRAVPELESRVGDPRGRPGPPPPSSSPWSPGRGPDRARRPVAARSRVEVGRSSLVDESGYDLGRGQRLASGDHQRAPGGAEQLGGFLDVGRRRDPDAARRWADRSPCRPAARGR